MCKIWMIHIIQTPIKSIVSFFSWQPNKVLQISTTIIICPKHNFFFARVVFLLPCASVADLATLARQI